MLKLDFQTKRGDILRLTGNEFFDLVNIDGQTMAQASLSSIITSGVDGDTITNIQAQPRSIILDLRIKSGVDVEEAKRAILEVIKIKQSGKLIWYQNGRTLSISGVVESVDMPRWNNAVLMQITFHCPMPFWEDAFQTVQEIDELSDLHYFTDIATDMLYFPSDGIALGAFDESRTRSFVNAGDVDIGIEILIRAKGTVTNPIIYDTDGNFFGVGYGTGAKQIVLSAGESIVITTHKGNKTVKKGNVSLYDYIKPNSQWLQLKAGANQFKIDSDDDAIDNMVFNLTYRQRYI